MEHTTLNVMAWDFPRAKTQPARELLKPYLLSHRRCSPLLSLDDHRNRLLLHPRIESEEDLPVDTVAGCYDLGGHSIIHSVTGVSTTDLDQIWTVLFDSASKPTTPLCPGLPVTWRRVLSNLHRTNLVIAGNRYATVEHYFQSQKALSSTRPEMAEWFIADYDGPEAIKDAPTAAKQAGGLKSYQCHGADLDFAKWETRRVDCMRIALHHRYEQDVLFHKVLDSTRKMRLLHHERAGVSSFWGGNFSRRDGCAVGQNQLGILLEQLRDRGRLL